MKGKALGKHSLHEKTAASVLLKLFNLKPTNGLRRLNSNTSILILEPSVVFNLLNDAAC